MSISVTHVSDISKGKRFNNKLKLGVMGGIENLSYKDVKGNQFTVLVKIFSHILLLTMASAGQVITMKTA